MKISSWYYVYAHCAAPNGLCIQIMEALCHIYGFAYCHLITVLPKIMKISWYGNSPDSAVFGTRGNNINGILVCTGYTYENWVRKFIQKFYFQ